MDETTGIDADSRNWAMGAHLSALAGAFLGGFPAFIGPLVVWLVRRDADVFSAEHGREALNFNITMVLLIVVAAIFAVLTLGLGLLIILPVGLLIGVVWIVVTVQATLAASRGEAYRYPLSLRLIKA